MLKVTFRNVSHLAPASDYEYVVSVNGHVLQTGKVVGHPRVKGWEALVKRFAEQLEEVPYE